MRVRYHFPTGTSEGRFVSPPDWLGGEPALLPDWIKIAEESGRVVWLRVSAITAVEILPEADVAAKKAELTG